MHAALGAKLMYRTVDAMWRAAGDTSTDFNFYTKRGILAGVYGSTAMRWFNDTSDGRKAHRGIPRRPHRECDAVREVQGQGQGSAVELPRLRRLGKAKANNVIPAERVLRASGREPGATVATVALGRHRRDDGALARDDS